MSSALPPWKRCLDPALQDADHYLDYVNTSLFPLMQAEPPRRVLDLGCAAGAFGAELKRRFPDAFVVGVEAGHAAAARARERLDRVVHARIEDLDFAAAGIEPGEFDTIVAADILEHLVNPWELLVKLRGHLAPGGQLISSIPNVRNVAVATALLGDGDFEYEERGLLDVTHLRFFTRKGLERLFAETGYRVEQTVGLMTSEWEEVRRSNPQQQTRNLKIGRITLGDVSYAEMMELWTVQFLVRARPL